jgi:hypothetical protein
MRSALRSWTCWMLVGLFSVAISGCNGDRLTTYPVTGNIDITGVGDLTAGEIVFTNDAVTAKGQIQKDGTFTLSTYADKDGAPAGKYEVYILGGAISKATSADPYAIEYVIDPKFGDRKTSGLEYTVEEGPNEFSVVVAPPPKK